MEKTFAKSLLAKLVLASSVLWLSGCVTQNFENDEPVVENQANKDDMAATRISLGLGYLKMGNMPQAKLNLEKAKRFAPDMVQVYTAFAHYYETVGEFELTEESYEKALSLKSDDGDTLNNYGVFLCRQDKIEQAEQQFLKAIAVPSYLLVAQSYQNLSACFLQEDDFDKAEQYLEKAILHSPNSSAALFQMVRLQYAKGSYARAKYFQQKFEKNTRRFSAESLALAYKVNIKLANPRVAKNYGTMLVKMFPQSWEAKQYLLNELELIDADNLAKRYQLTQHKTRANSGSKKRVVKLSPNRKAPITSSKKKQTTLAKTNTQATAQATEQIRTKTAQTVAVAAKAAPQVAAQPAVLAANSSSAQNTALVLSSAHESNNVTDTNLQAEEAEPQVTEQVNTEQISAEPLSTEQVANEQVNEEAKVVSNQVVDKADNQATTASAAPEAGESQVEQTNASMNPAQQEVVTASEKSLVTEAVLTEQVLENSQAQASTELDNALVNDAEPTFTQPVPAKRDQPLPEAVIETPTSQAEVTADTSIEASIKEKEQQLSAMLAEQENLVNEAEASQALPEKVAVVEQDDGNELGSGSTELATKDEAPVAKEVVTGQTIDAKTNEQITAVPVQVDSTEVVEQVIDENEEKAEQVLLTHKVSAGETLFAISVKYNVKIKALREWNDISANNKLRIGQELVVAAPNQ